MKTFTALLIATLCWPTPCLAAGPEASLQISKAGLDYLGAALPGHLPTSFVTPYLEQKIVDCGFAGKTRVKIQAATISFAVQSLVITPSTGRLSVDISAAISATAPTTFSVCVAGSFNCSGHVSIKSARGSVSFSPQVVAGQLRLGAPTVSLDVSHNDTSIWFSGCGVAGALINAAVSLFKGMIVAKARDALQSTLQESLPPLLEQSLAGMTKLTETFDNYTVTGQLAAVDSQSAGLTVGASVDIAALVQAPCAGPAPALPPPPLADPVLAVGTDHLALALSSRAIASALGAAYASGLFCLPQQKLTEMGVDTAPFKVGAILLGMHSLASVDVSADGPPTSKLLPGDGARLALELPVAITMAGQGPKGPTTLTLKGMAALEVHLRLDATKQAIVLDVKSVAVQNLSATATDPFGLQLGVAKLQALVNIAVSLLTAKIGSLEVAPQSFSAKTGPLSAHYFYLARTTTAVDYVQLYGKLLAMPAADKKPPMATFSNQTSGVPGMPLGSGIAVLASDEQTPTDLLRYSWRVDGGAWSMASSSKTLPAAALADGAHTIEAAVLDLSGNRTEAKLELDVDRTPPLASLLPPSSTTTTSSDIGLSWTLSDDRTPAAEVRSKIQARHVESGVFVLDTDFAAGVGAAPPVPFTARGDYEVRVFAQDLAGNVSDPSTLTVTYEGDGEPLPNLSLSGGHMEGGCTLAGRDVPRKTTLPVALLLLWALAWRRGRSSRDR